MGTKKHITGIILAGGTSTRMGSDKALMSLNGKPFMRYVIQAVTPLVDSLFIVSNHKQHDQFGLDRIPDLFQEAGPLAGLYAGLSHTQTIDNLVLSCDIPLISTPLLKYLMKSVNQEDKVVQLEARGKSMPLIACYKKSCTNQIAELLEQGERRLRTAVNTLNPKTIPVADKWAYQTTNINTPEELKKIAYAVTN